MENHPIPQDITGFKFRLIGSITLKQFMYLFAAGGLSLAVYFFPISLFLKIPIIGVFALIGGALAFVPIDGRPMDKMLMNFLKALPAENAYLYHKRGTQILAFDFVQPARAVQHVTQDTTSQSQAANRALLFSQLRNAYQPDTQELENLKAIDGLFQGTEQSPATRPIIHADTAPAAPVRIVPPAAAPRAAQPVALPQAEAPAASPAQPTLQQTMPAAFPPVVAAPAPAATNPTPPARVAQSIPDSPNVIFGHVMDARGKILPHVLVEVLDQNQVPVRAFKTNQVGEFRSATPLPNGNYTIHLEDALHKQEFAPIPVALNGSIMQPLVITSDDQREKLRRELFGGTA